MICNELYTPKQHENGWATRLRIDTLFNNIPVYLLIIKYQLQAYNDCRSLL